MSNPASVAFVTAIACLHFHRELNGEGACGEEVFTSPESAEHLGLARASSVPASITVER